MRKSIRIRDLDCANCASKIEKAASKLDGVISVKVNFMNQKMILEANDEVFSDVFAEVKNIARKIDSDIEFVL